MYQYPFFYQGVFKRGLKKCSWDTLPIYAGVLNFYFFQENSKKKTLFLLIYTRFYIFFLWFLLSTWLHYLRSKNVNYKFIGKIGLSVKSYDAPAGIGHTGRPKKIKTSRNSISMKVMIEFPGALDLFPGSLIFHGRPVGPMPAGAS